MRTQTKLDELVHALQSNCGDRFDACRQCAVSPVFVSTWMKDDKDVHAAIVEAERVGALALQSEAIRRAVHGVDKGVYFKGERVDTETVYSDGLLQTLLKGRLPETYGKDAEGLGGVTANNVQINIMPRANSYEEWLSMRDKTLDRRDALDAADRALPVPQIELTAMPIPASPFEGLGL